MQELNSKNGHDDKHAINAAFPPTSTPMDADKYAAQDEAFDKARAEIDKQRLEKIQKAGGELRNAYNQNKSTDMGNSERLAAFAGDDLRFVPGMGWLVYDSGVWRANNYAAVEIYKKRVIPAIYQEIQAFAATHDNDNIKKTSAWAKRSEEAARAEGALKMARGSEPFHTSSSKLDADPMLLNVENGTIDLRTGKLRAHRRSDLITKIAPVNYDPNARCPVFEKFLLQIMGGDKELVAFIQRVVGYSLTGCIKEQCWFICHGVGANGKGTLLNTLLQILGDYGAQAAPDLLMLARGGGEKHPTEQADLMGRRLVVAQETESGRQLAEVAVKQMTGGDKMKARFMRGDFFEFFPTHKILLATNHKPVIKDTTESTWRRIHLIPFEKVVPAEERDKDLSEKLLAEASGILSWAIAGCLEWQKIGLKPPKKVRAATEEYREESDVIGLFLEDKTTRKNGERETLDDLHKAYVEWAETSKQGVFAKTSFSRLIKERGFDIVRHGPGMVVKGLLMKKST